MATYITITGQYLSVTGQPLAGTVRFTLHPAVHVPGVGVIESDTRVTLDNAGAFSVDLLANTDPAVSPSGSYYVVQEQVGGARREYAVTVPHNLGSPLDLASLAPAQGSPPQTAYVLQSVYAAHVATAASTTVLGHVKVDGTSITADPDGTLHSSGGALPGDLAYLDVAQSWTQPQTFPAHTKLTGAAGDTYLDLNAPTGQVNIVSFQVAGTEHWEFFADAHTFGVYETATNLTRLSVDDGGNMSLNYQLNLGPALALPSGGGARVLAFEGPALTAQQWPGTGTVAPDSLILQTSPFTTGNVGTGTGSSLLFQADTTAEFLQDQARLTATWGGDVTTATRAARLTATVDDYAGVREGWRIEADGTAPRIGFLGAAAVPRGTLPAAATDAASTQALANAIRALLIAVGLAS